MMPEMVIKTSEIRCLALGDLGPEKAGVGGSIPSLATTFSTTYRHPKSGFGYNILARWVSQLLKPDGTKSTNKGYTAAP